MQYRLRTLLILMAIGPPMLAWSWFGWLDYREHQRRDSLMMTITPGLVILEEEELTLGIDLPDP